ncbi:hypothetical protein AV530_013129 [Patagioenas fasciata monilis]|uniref:Uncharacterized protein n=1 Tax=Patagioenas fasciata monilis TaxID=372326 RepID=A0A1V4JAQ9_PATFA|nr:hypothetical protein AV530_013129 [Patagioenas fasciata monilis]
MSCSCWSVGVRSGDSTQVNLLWIKKKVLELHVRKGKQRAADRFQQLETEVSVNKERRKWLSSVQSPFYFKQAQIESIKASIDERDSSETKLRKQLRTQYSFLSSIFIALSICNTFKQEAGHKKLRMLLESEWSGLVFLVLCNGANMSVFPDLGRNHRPRGANGAVSCAPAPQHRDASPAKMMKALTMKTTATKNLQSQQTGRAEACEMGNKKTGRRNMTA